MQKRASYQEIQNKDILVLRGCVPGHPDFCVAGWYEKDSPGVHDSEAPYVLQEPIYFKNELVSAPQGSAQPPQYRPVLVVPEFGLPAYAVIHDYQKAEVFEGISPFGQIYITAVKHFRENRPPALPPNMVTAILKHVPEKK